MTSSGILSGLVTALLLTLSPVNVPAALKAVYERQRLYNQDSPLLEQYRKAMGLYWSADYGAAEQAFQDLVRQDHRFSSAYIFLADSQMGQGKRQPAYLNYEKAYEILQQKNEERKSLFPDLKDPEIYADMLYCLNALGRYKEAKKLGVILGLPQGESPDLYMNIAYALYKLDEKEMAQVNFCKSREIGDPVELKNLTYLRLSRLFENGREWIRCPDESGPQRGKNYALLIGVGKFKESTKIRSLKYTGNDVSGIKRVLTSPQTGIFDPDDVTVLLNEKATLRNMKFRMAEAVAKVQNEEDLLFVFYAGHGYAGPDGSDTYWLAYDTEYDEGAAYMTQATAYSNLELAKTLFNLKAGKVVFLIDACHSSGMADRPTGVGGLAEGIKRTGKEYVIITSAQADKVSIESDDLKHGLFSYYIIEALSGKADSNSDGKIEAGELWTFLKERIPAHARDMGLEQVPRLSSSFEGSIFLSKNPNY